MTQRPHNNLYFLIAYVHILKVLQNNNVKLFKVSPVAVVEVLEKVEYSNSIRVDGCNFKRQPR